MFLVVMSFTSFGRVMLRFLGPCNAFLFGHIAIEYRSVNEGKVVLTYLRSPAVLLNL
jgi:hypothetical protein